MPFAEFSKTAAENISNTGSKAIEYIKQKKKDLIKSLISFVIVFTIVLIINRVILGVHPSIWDTILIIATALITKPLVSYIYHKASESFNSQPKFGNCEFLEPV